MRKQASLTQWQLAEAMGYERTHIASVEGGYTAMSAEFVEAAVVALRCNADEAIELLAVFAIERGFIIVRGDDVVTSAIVAYVQRERRAQGAQAVCPECKASAVDPCRDGCPVRDEQARRNVVDELEVSR